MLSSTERMGMKECAIGGAEHLLPWVRSGPRTADWSATSLREFFGQRFRESATENGVAGFKVMWKDLNRVLNQAARAQSGPATAPEDIGAYLPPDICFIRLIRRDKVRQAVSWAKAAQTGAWTSQEQSGTCKPVAYDYLQLRWTLAEIRRSEAAWDRFFQVLNLEPLTLYYEDYVQDVGAAVRSVGRELAVDVEDFRPPARPKFRRQTDGVNDDWLARFERDQADGIARASATVRAAVSSTAPWKRAFHVVLNARRSRVAC